MNQVGLVFRKDVHHLWRELAVYVAVLVCFAVMVPQTRPGRFPAEESVSIFVTVLQILMGLSMVVLIARAVQADNPTGDSQFWVTRPYRWNALLGAKLLFVVVCVAMPYVVMQWVLLWTAGLGVLSSVHGLIMSVTRVALGVWLPLIVAASVTESIGAMIMFVAGLLLAWAATLQFVLASTESRMSPRYEFFVLGPLFGALMVWILMYQYAKRRTGRSRVAIAGLLGLFLLLIFGVDRQGFGAPIRKLIAAQCRVPKDAAMKLVFAPGSIPYDERQQDVDMRLKGGLVELRLPVLLEGLPTDARIREPHAAVEVVGKDGFYASPWQDAKVSDDAMEITLPKTVYDGMVAGRATTFRVQMAAEELRLARTSEAAVGRHFNGPHGGVCEGRDGDVICRFAYEQQVPTQVWVRSSGGACGTKSTSETVLAEPWLVFPAGGRFDPVVQEPVKPKDERDICSGDVLTFSEYAVEKTFRLMVDVPMENIAQYRVTPR